MSVEPFPADLWLARLKTLIEQRSVSAPGTAQDCSNKSVVDILANWLSDQGFRCNVQLLPKNPLDLPDTQPEKYNLYAQIGPDTSGGLALAGHVDTVPACPEKWRSDPWTLTHDEAQVTGLGSSDMKGFFASILAVLSTLDLKQLKKPLMVIATADEESNMHGAEYLSKEALQHISQVIIGEPTDNVPIRMHKGILMERLILRGQAGHSSRPSDGRNAIAGLKQLIGALQELQADFIKTYSQQEIYQAYDVPWPTLNFGRVVGGDIPNRIADQCALDIDCRFFADKEIPQIRKMIYDLTARVAQAQGLQFECQSLFSGIEGMHTDAQAKLIQCLEQHSQPSQGVSFCTEGPYFARLVDEVAIWGPGNIALAHQPNEYILLDKVKLFHNNLSQVIQQLCFN